MGRKTRVKGWDEISPSEDQPLRGEEGGSRACRGSRIKTRHQPHCVGTSGNFEAALCMTPELSTKVRLPSEVTSQAASWTKQGCSLHCSSKPFLAWCEGSLGPAKSLWGSAYPAALSGSQGKSTLSPELQLLLANTKMGLGGSHPASRIWNCHSLFHMNSQSPPFTPTSPALARRVKNRA